MIRPEHIAAWLGALEGHCGWEVPVKDLSSRGKEHPVGRARLPDGGTLPLHMLDARYTPDVPSPMADRIRERIARKSETGSAILSYAVPAFWSSDRGASRRGLLLGGSLLADGAWRDFALTKARYGGKGIADVLDQPALTSGRPPEAFVERYAFDLCPDLAVLLAGEMSGIPRDEVVGDFMGTQAGWAIVSARRASDPIPAEVARLIRP
jgi:hypothetical protein